MIIYLSVVEFWLILAEVPYARLIGVILVRAARITGANNFHYDTRDGRKSNCLPPGETRIIRRIGRLFTGNLLPPPLDDLSGHKASSDSGNSARNLPTQLSLLYSASPISVVLLS